MLKLRAGEMFHPEVMLPIGVSADKAMSDLLRLLFRKIIDTLSSVYGKVESLSAVALVIAIPSSMQEATVNLISQCLRVIGFPVENILFVYEAEASLIYAVSRGFNRFHRRLLIVDSGGITTSTTLCSFDENGRTNCTHGLVELCGSELTDIKFMKYLEKRLGPVYTDLRIRRPTELLQCKQSD
jgi:molecular chaperone DnaK (HSP70)